MARHTNDRFRGILGISGGHWVMQASELVGLHADSDRYLLEHVSPRLDAIVIIIIIILLCSLFFPSIVSRVFISFFKKRALVQNPGIGGSGLLVPLIYGVAKRGSDVFDCFYLYSFSICFTKIKTM